LAARDAIRKLQAARPSSRVWRQRVQEPPELQDAEAGRGAPAVGAPARERSAPKT
jgi:hypothetical protein